MKKFFSLFLSLVMLCSITAGIDFAASAASYNSDYKRWSQGKSSYSWMRNYGCWVVAEAKLIYETGINKTSSFNPDVYYKWATNKGYVNNGGNVYSDNPVRYAKSLGNNKLSYEGVTSSNLTNKVINNAKSGYYSIIKVKTSSGGTHYIMANNSKTKSTGKIYIYDSWNSANEPPATFAWSDIKSKVGVSYTMTAVYTFKYGGSSAITNPSVTVKGATKITSSSARIDFTANNPSKVTIKTVGVQVRKKGDSSWQTKTEAMNSNYMNAASTPMYWTVGKGQEFNITLNQGTTYEYRAYVVYNGTNYYSAISTFKTTGHSHSYSSWKITTNPTCESYGVKTYYCSCGATKTESIAPLGHSYVTKPYVAPSCTEWGMTAYSYCSRCGYYSVYPSYIEPTEHTYVKDVTKATLSQNGKTVNKCTGCGKVAKTTTVYYPKTVKLSKNTFTYNGKAQKPSVIVKDSKGNTLKLNKDYTVSYSNASSKNVGKYTVTIKFKGNYTGTKTIGYHINPKPTEFVPSNKGGFKAVSKGFTLKWNKQASQTTGYQIQYATKRDFSNAATITIANPNTTSKTIKGRAGNTRYYVRVRTYKKIGTGTFYSSWNSGVKSVVTLR